ncbi:MAG: pantoate--beta-alanine ligase [Acidiferrobacteraceae bacterium]
MDVCRDPESLRAARRALMPPLAFVPTMGNLHDGHLRLVEQARALAGSVAVSIYVNPLQFGPHEDLGSYPRTLERDLDVLRASGADLVFVPEDRALYPRGFAAHTRVDVPGLSSILCGALRPGHFTGVATVVCRLFHLVAPEVAVFGKKDYQQLLIVRRMVEDLALDVDIIGVDTVRAPDGLALSSRNAYLDSEERQRASGLYFQLRQVALAVAAGVAPEEAETRALEGLRGSGLAPDYVTVRRRDDLATPVRDDRVLIVLGAVRLGRTRLIDNVEFERP